MSTESADARRRQGATTQEWQRHFSWRTVIGVVGDTKDGGLDAPPEEQRRRMRAGAFECHGISETVHSSGGCL